MSFPSFHSPLFGSSCQSERPVLPDSVSTIAPSIGRPQLPQTAYLLDWISRGGHDALLLVLLGYPRVYVHGHLLSCSLTFTGSTSL
jgi:hypothetical protein